MNKFNDPSTERGKLSSNIEVGVISEVRGDKARVKIGENIVTDFLPVLQLANSFVKKWTPLRVKEQCVVLPIRGSINAGIILRGIFYTKYPAPTTGEKEEKIKYEDGTTTSYNTDKKLLSVELCKDASIIIKGSTEITSPNTKHEGNITVIGDLIVKGSVSVDKNVSVVGIAKAQAIVGESMVVGDSKITAAGGSFSLDKPLKVKGNITAEGGDIEASGLLRDRFGPIRTSNPNEGGGS